MNPKSLYKYTKINKNFFKNYCLRITPNSDLNDPFEVIPLKDNLGSVMSAEIIDEYEEIIKRYGILSLTEDFHNYLMWAHYADNHKGIVIEINTEFNNFITRKTGNFYDRDIFDSELNRVVYSKFRGYPIDKNTVFNGQVIRDVLNFYFFLKSEEWLYEKEHRLVLPFETADSAIVTPEKSQQEACLQRLEELGIVPDERSERSITINSFAHDDRACQKIIQSKIKNSFDYNIMFFKRIDPRNIKSIYFGARCPSSEIEECIRLSNKLIELGTNFYQAKLHDSRFELIFEKINL